MRSYRCAIAAAAIASAPRPVHAAAPLAPDGTRPHVDVESAWIVWDPDSKRQDLILSAQLSQVKGPFTYVAPLPSHPEIAAVEVDLRLALAKLIAGYQRRAPNWQLPPRDGRGPLASVAFGELGKVEAVTGDTLAAVIGAPLERPWPAVDAWLQRYTKPGWELVGLRVSGTRLPNVRLTFQAERPFYPYREPPWSPDDHRPGEGRVLRVTMIAPEQVAWQAGPAVPTMSQAWLSFEVAHDELQGVFGELYGSLFDAGKRYWLTSFEDWHEVHVGDDDVTFARRGPIPADGQAGTLGDKTGKGLRLEPIGPAPVASAVAEAKEPERETGGTARGRGGRGRKVLLGAAIVMLVAGAWAYARRA